jgi:hypothetical protein
MSRSPAFPRRVVLTAPLAALAGSAPAASPALASTAVPVSAASLEVRRIGALLRAAITEEIAAEAAAHSDPAKEPAYEAACARSSALYSELHARAALQTLAWRLAAAPVVAIKVARRISHS